MSARVDPLPGLVAEWEAHKAASEASDDDDDGSLWWACHDAERAVCSTVASSLEALAAQSRFVRSEVGDAIRAEWSASSNRVVENFCLAIEAFAGRDS
ncbi:hypothetical protein [Tropicimonas aquimaris]|uniref:Uncharacterized protein n=1 Tax=Tropicimonas aquimaris TaxID=914152 RepID=A0ABW3IJH6_9RHOB